MTLFSKSLFIFLLVNLASCSSTNETTKQTIDSNTQTKANAIIRHKPLNQAAIIEFNFAKDIEKKYDDLMSSFANKSNKINWRSSVMTPGIAKQVSHLFSLIDKNSTDEVIKAFFTLKLKSKSKSKFDAAFINRVIGNLYAKIDDYENGILYLEKSISGFHLNKNEHISSLKTLILLNMQQENHHKAIDYTYDLLAARGHLTSDNHLKLALSFYKLKEYAMAAAASNKAYVIDNRNIKSLSLNLSAWYDIKYYNNAVSAAHLILESDPNNHKMMKTISNIYFMADDYNNAIKYMELLFIKSINRTEKNMIRLGKMYRLNGKHELATALLADCLKEKKCTENENNFSLLASWYSDNENLKQAEAYYDRAFNLSNNYIYKSLLAQTLINHKQVEAATKAINLALQNPLEDEAKYHSYTILARILLAEMKYQQAIFEAEKVPSYSKYYDHAQKIIVDINGTQNAK
ncbi:tetratricopeptide repeat protein [Algibacillus agarilyticus]|uniref:tetratricopeptide repeat protein n=1 Tax=Algibacillus agarilyticus TaxID=2234133 RepID=UPI000DD077C2|nr:hypothetical protein [Algibacillus agarilyticus]